MKINKTIGISVSSALLSFIAGSIFASVISSNKKKNNKIYAGDFICVQNENTKEIELYLNIKANVEDIVQSETVTFKVKNKKIDKEEIAQA